MALEHWLHLRLADGLGPKLTGRLLEVCGDAGSAVAATPAALRQVSGIGKLKAEAIYREIKGAGDKVRHELDAASAAGVTLLCRDDPEYPPMLRDVHDAPTVLWVRGELQPRDLNAVAVVGSRDCSAYGREQAGRFSTYLAGAGHTIASGGARGIDAAAHDGALRHPAGRTIAVLGCGVDVAYPPEHADLLSDIAERGAVVSEYPIGTQPRRENFPPRNRIISGLSRGVLIIEAAERSGAHITARVAIEEQGRPVMALPGRIDNPMSAGPHNLIRDGATLVTHPEQVPPELGPLPDAVERTPGPAVDLFDLEPVRPDPITDAALSDDEKTLLHTLAGDTRTADDLIATGRLPAHAVLTCLTTLTLKGRLEKVGGQTYRGKR